jgi:hypothetical protein
MNLAQLRPALLLAVTGLTLTVYNCISPGDSNGSGVGNGMITGKLYEPDGITPANGAIVTVWDRNAQPKVDSSGQVSQSTPVLQTRTDENGVYSIERIEPGFYAIEASDSSNNMARIDSIVIPNEETSLDSLSDTLKAPGVIKGKIVCDSNIYVQYINCFGTHYSCYPFSKGSFIIAPLTEGYYELEIVFYKWPARIDFRVVHKTIWVSSGDTTNVTIMSDDIPVINEIGITYDSSKHYTTINWKAEETTIPLGYNVYRRISGDSSFGSPLNGSKLIHDTMFVDSTAFSGTIYQYTVAAVDSTNRIGPLSGIVTTSTSNSVINLGTLTKLVEPVSEVGEGWFVMYTKDPRYLYLANYNSDPNISSYIIQKYNTSDGSLVNSLKVTGIYDRWIALESDRIFFQKLFNHDSLIAIVCRDSSGNERILESYTARDFGGGDVVGNSIAFVTFSGIQDSSEDNYSITRSLTTDGMVVYSIKAGFLLRQDFRAVRICADGTICLFLTSHILRFDTSGHEKASIKLPQISFPSQLFGYSDSMYLVLSFDGYRASNEGMNFDFSVYNFSNEQLFKYKIQGVYSYNPYLTPNGDIYLLASDKLNGKVSVYRLPNPLSKD